MDPQQLLLDARASYEAGQWEEALACLDQVVVLTPAIPGPHVNRGTVLLALARTADALASFDRALTLDPRHAGALNNRGNALSTLGRFEDALASYDRALAARPDFAVAWNGRGNVLRDMGQADAALVSYDKALRFNPHYPDAFCNRGRVFADQGRSDAALASFEQALTLQPGHADALYHRAAALQSLARFEEALAAFEQAAVFAPANIEITFGLGTTLWQMNRFEAALAVFDRVLARDPGHADAHNYRGTCLSQLGRLEEAAQSFEAALRLAPRHRYAFGHLAATVQQLCDWRRMEVIAAEIETRVTQGGAIVPALAFLGYCDAAAPQLACARNYMRDRVTVVPPPLWTGAPYRHDKIRIAYLSSDFRRHATSVLMAELLERHDRSRFEVTGISYAPDDESALRARIVRAFDRFHDVDRKSQRDIAALLRREEIDIAIDLNGHTRNSYPEILSWRPAPVQVNFLGYPGTMAAGFMDYIIADAMTVPMDHQPFFAEKIVHLPDCYQPNDSKREIADAPLARTAAGLPEEGFVFCCFNAGWKIAPAVFDVWMRLLKAVPGSVLWLVEDGAAAGANLRAEAAARGVDPARLVFAPRLEFAEHLARHRLADLFLDTLHYNAHTTASDALWAGLPLVTCQGQTFAARVAASLLTAAGMADLVTTNLADYEALALRLAREPKTLGGLRDKLAEGRDSCALFDAARFARNIEAAYTAMWERAERGEPPRAFAVTPGQES